MGPGRVRMPDHPDKALRYERQSPWLVHWQCLDQRQERFSPGSPLDSDNWRRERLWHSIPLQISMMALFMSWTVTSQ